MKKFTPILICLFLGLITSTHTSAQNRNSSIIKHLKQQKNTAPSPIDSLPYNESFESNIAWNQSTSDSGNWTRNNDGTPSENTGPSNGAEGSYYLFLEASAINNTDEVGVDATAIIESPCFDFSAKTDVNFSFSNHMYGTNVGSLILQACTNNEKWTSIWSFAGNNGNQWNKVEISLNEYLNEKEVKLRFVGITGNGWSSDIAIDALSITTKTNNTNDKKAPVTPINVKISSKSTSSTRLSYTKSTNNVMLVKNQI